MADKAHRETDKLLLSLERRIRRIYRQTQDEVRQAWDDYMAKTEPKLASLQEKYEAAKAAGDKAEIKKPAVSWRSPSVKRLCKMTGSRALRNRPPRI